MAMLTKDVRVGQEFAGKPKKMSWERLWTFSGGPFTAEGWPRKNIHTDPGFAQSVGLPRVAASGTQCQGYMVELMTDLFGEAWLHHGEMSVKFVKPVPDGETVQAKVKVQSREEGDRTRINLGGVRRRGGAPRAPHGSPFPPVCPCAGGPGAPPPPGSGVSPENAFLMDMCLALPEPAGHEAGRFDGAVDRGGSAKRSSGARRAAAPPLVPLCTSGRGTGPIAGTSPDIHH